MKKYIIILVGLFFSFSLTSCEKSLSYLFGKGSFVFKNNAQYDIMFYSPLIKPHTNDPNENIIYPDTSLCPQMPSKMFVIHSREEGYYNGYRGKDTREDIWPYNDTISLFVFNADSVSKYGWDPTKEELVLLQRYDVVFDEITGYGKQPTFPPTEAMRDIKMWPPYGTYDANGHKLENYTEY